MSGREQVPTGFRREPWSGKVERVLHADCGLCHHNTYAANTTELRQGYGWRYTRRWGWVCNRHSPEEQR